MNVALIKTKAETALGDQFEAMLPHLPGSDWVSDLRRKAIGIFQTHGLPHRRIEDWKYTDLRETLREAYPPVVATESATSTADIDRALGPLADFNADRLVFVDGRYRADLSRGLRRGFEFKPMGETLTAAPAWLQGKFDVAALAEQDATRVLNAAFMTDGALLKISRDHVLQRPIMLVFARSAGEPSASTTRNVLAVEEGSTVTLIEAHVALNGSAARSQTNTGTDLVIARGGRLTHIKCMLDGQATHLSSWSAKLGQAASYEVFHLTPGSALSRNQVFVTFTGEDAKVDVSGLFLGRGRDHIDTTLVIDHAVPGCESRELFKGVLDGRARGVFQGKVIVRPNAQKTDGKQMAQVLMLSEDAEFDSKPELEIFADDVVCGHGSTCAQIDEDMLFYCRSRGIPEAQARAMLIESFAAEAVEKVEDEVLREKLAEIARAWLAPAGS
jgi:Fe-S cluster assembly protein SufD